MNEDTSQNVPIMDLREGDLVDFTDQVNRYDMSESVAINGQTVPIGDYTQARVQAAFLHLGHDRVMVVTDQIMPYLPMDEQVRRISRAERSGTPADPSLQD